MSANSINETEQLPVWTVHGQNWEVDVPLDAYNAQFDLEQQAYEAATKAIAAFKGKSDDLFIKIDGDETTPLLGTTMIADLKGTDKRFTPLTHVVLANDGYYKDSFTVFQTFMQQLAAIEQDMANDKRVQAELAEQFKQYQKLQETLARKQRKGKVKKTKKRIDNPPSSS